MSDTVTTARLAEALARLGQGVERAVVDLGRMIAIDMVKIYMLTMLVVCNDA